MIEAVLFDFDSLIVAGREEDMFVEALEDLEEGMSLKFFEFCVEDYEWHGFCSPKEVLQRFLEWETFEPEAKMEQINEILEEMKDNVEVKSKLEDIVEILEDEGIAVGAVMNSEEEEILLHDLEIFDLFDYVFVGDEMSAEKPFEGFYKRTCEIMDYEPFEVLLVEDFMNDLAPANNHGLLTAFLKMENLEDIGEHLEEEGIEFPDEFEPDYEINSLEGVLDIVEDLND